MNSKLADQECKACDGGTPVLKDESLRRLKDQLGGAWQVANEQRLERKFKFPDFRQALEFTDQVGEIAEEQGHHPDIYLTYGEVRLQIWTHKAGGLTESDFILAARINGLDQTESAKKSVHVAAPKK